MGPVSGFLLNREAFLLVIAVPSVLLTGLGLLSKYLAKRHKLLRNSNEATALRVRCPDNTALGLFIFYVAILPWREQAGDFDTMLLFLAVCVVGIGSSLNFKKATRRFWILNSIRVSLQTLVMLAFFISSGARLIPIIPESVEAGNERFRYSFHSARRPAFWKSQAFFVLLIDLGVCVKDLRIVALYKSLKLIGLYVVYFVWDLEDEERVVEGALERMAWEFMRRSRFLLLVVTIETISVLFKWCEPNYSLPRVKFSALFQPITNRDATSESGLLLSKDAPSTYVGDVENGSSELHPVLDHDEELTTRTAGNVVAVSTVALKDELQTAFPSTEAATANFQGNIAIPEPSATRSEADVTRLEADITSLETNATDPEVSAESSDANATSPAMSITPTLEVVPPAEGRSPVTPDGDSN